MARDHRWRARGRPRIGVTRRTAICCLAVLVLGGCSAAAPPEPEQPTQTTGSPGPTPPSGSGGTGLIPPDTDTNAAEPTAHHDGASQPPSPPEAATLAWLAGASDGDGVLLETERGQRWQGRVAGEYALLSKSGYQWFGADGSMVGCVTGAGCAAVDSDGDIAVTAKRKGPRLVFSSDGDFLGRYSAKGDKMAAPGTTPVLTKALATSGVDVAGLVNAASLSAPFAGGATGDPHLITAGGVRFTTQRVGQFVARGGDAEHGIQLQLAPMAHRQDVSLVTGVAIDTGGGVITVDDTGSLTVDGKVRARSAKFDQVTLANGVAIGRWPESGDRSVSVAVVWPDGGSVVMTARPALGITVVAHLPPIAGAVGLFGASGRRAGTDLVSRAGRSAGSDRTVASWTVAPTERLFASTPTPVPGFPQQTATVDPGAAPVGQRSCAGHGLHNSDDLAACAFDVALTGDTGFVPGHVELAVPAESRPVADSFAARWPALLFGSSGGASSLPDGGLLDLTVPAHESRTFRIGLDGPGIVRLVNQSGCGIDEAPPGIDQPAMRLFDAAGRPVSDRFALCGHEQSPTLPAGSYYLVVAAGPESDRYVRVDVTLP